MITILLLLLELAPTLMSFKLENICKVQLTNSKCCYKTTRKKKRDNRQADQNKLWFPSHIHPPHAEHQFRPTHKITVQMTPALFSKKLFLVRISGESHRKLINNTVPFTFRTGNRYKEAAFHLYLMSNKQHQKKSIKRIPLKQVRFISN